MPGESRAFGTRHERWSEAPIALPHRRGLAAVWCLRTAAVLLLFPSERELKVGHAGTDAVERGEIPHFAAECALVKRCDAATILAITRVRASRFSWTTGRAASITQTGSSPAR